MIPGKHTTVTFILTRRGGTWSKSSRKQLRTTMQEDAQPAALQDFTQRFPTELSLYIFGWLEFPDLLVCHAVCRSWQLLAQDDSFYRRLYIKMWNLQGLPQKEVRLPICGIITSWKELLVYRRKMEWKYFAKEPEEVTSDNTDTKDSRDTSRTEGREEVTSETLIDGFSNLNVSDDHKTSKQVHVELPKKQVCI